MSVRVSQIPVVSVGDVGLPGVGSADHRQRPPFQIPAARLSPGSEEGIDSSTNELGDRTPLFT
jgi:hypothetical protein